MLIKMLKDAKGSNDCLGVEQYYRGKMYEVSHSNGVNLISRGCAIEDEYSSIKSEILSNNETKLGDYFNRLEIDRILNSKTLDDAQKIELLLLTKPKKEDN